MNAFDVFKSRVASMRAQIKDKEAEYVRLEVLGLEVREMQKHKNADETIEIVGFDENNVETVLICPLSHFSAKLSFAPKKTKREPIGFKLGQESGSERF
jgi:hypothetical protein